MFKVWGHQSINDGFLSKNLGTHKVPLSKVQFIFNCKCTFIAQSFLPACVGVAVNESKRFYAGASYVVSADKTCRHSRNCWRTVMNGYLTRSLTIHNAFCVAYYLHHQQHHNTTNLDNEHTTYSYHNTLDV